MYKMRRLREVVVISSSLNFLLLVGSYIPHSPRLKFLVRWLVKCTLGNFQWNGGVLRFL